MILEFRCKFTKNIWKSQIWGEKESIVALKHTIYLAVKAKNIIFAPDYETEQQKLQ